MINGLKSWPFHLYFVEDHVNQKGKFHIRIFADLNLKELIEDAAIQRIYFSSIGKEKWNSIDQATQMYLRKGYSQNRSLNAQQVLDGEYVSKLVQEDEAYKVLVGDRSSPSYWQLKMKELMSMIRQIGKPDLFLTLSAAETKWNELLVILVFNLTEQVINEDQANSMSFEEKCDLIRKDPVTCARYFDHRLRELFKIIRAANGPFASNKVRETYIRVEFQSRGSPHIHCLIWLEGSPIYSEENTESTESCVSFIDQFITCSVENMNGLEKLQFHKHSPNYCQKGRIDSMTCRFGIPFYPMTKTMILKPLKDGDLTDEEAEHIDFITERINKHLKILDQKVKVGDHELEHMTTGDFLNVCEVTEDQYVKCIRNNLKRPQVYLKRRPSEIRTNAYNKLILELHRANMDIQFILDPYACVHYILNYINKSDRGMSSLLKQVVDECKRGNISHQTKLYKISSKFLSCSEVSVQEAVYILLRMQLSSASRDTVFINTGEKEKRTRRIKMIKELQELDPDSNDVMSNGLLEYYVNRPEELESVCLADFAANFSFIKNSSGDYELSTVDQEDILDKHKRYSLKNNMGTLFERRKRRIIRYRKYQFEKDPNNFYREKIMLYLPWRNEDEDILLKNGKLLYEQNRDQIHNIEKNYVFDLQLDLDQLEKFVEKNSREEFVSYLEEDVDEEFQIFDLQRPDHNYRN